MAGFIEHCASLSHGCSLFRIHAIVSPVRRETETRARLGQRRFSLLYTQAVVIGVDDGDDLSSRNNAAKIDGDRANATRNLHADCRLIVCGECAVSSYRFAERCFGNSRSFDLTHWAALACPLALSLRRLVITLARRQKKRRQQERHSC